MMTEEPKRIGRASQIIDWMQRAGGIAVAVGAVGLATAFAVERVMDDDSGFSISDAAQLFWTSVVSTAILLMIHVTILAMLVFLPARFAWKRPIRTTWVTMFSALAGGLILSLPWLIKWLLAYTSGMITITSTSQADEWIGAAAYAAAGCFVGAVFGFAYAKFELRGGGLPNEKPAKPAEKTASNPETLPAARSSTDASWFLTVLLLAFAGLAGLVVWYFTTPLRTVSSARRAAVENQSAIVAEAQKMLDEAALAEDGYFDYGYSSGPPLPEVFAKTGAYSATTSQRLPGVVKLPVTGGFTHFGLFIVPEPTSATVPMLRDAVVHEDYGSLKIVNDQLYQYSEGP